MLTLLDRQIARLWRDSALRRTKPGRRIAVVGNCQSFGYAFAMKLFDPTLEVDRYPLVAPSLAGLKTLQSALSGYDLVFSQEFGTHLLRDNGDSKTLFAALPHIVRLPTVAFYGYHPDTIYLVDPTQGGKFILGPAGVHHSALVLFAYLRGLSIDQAEALFSREAFEFAGYLGVWASAAEDLLRAGAAAGMNLEADLPRWARGRPFMYTPVHPRPPILFDIARRAMLGAGLAVQSVETDDYAVDDMSRDHILPIYPPLAEHYGLRGSTVFKLAHFKFRRGVGQVLTLREYVARCFAFYADRRREQLAHARVDEWLANEDTARALALLSSEELKRRALSR